MRNPRRIVVPHYSGYRNRARVVVAISDIKNIAKAITLFKLDNDKDSETLGRSQQAKHAGQRGYAEVQSENDLGGCW